MLKEMAKACNCYHSDIRPSADLRNHYNEISKQCHETRGGDMY